jgi:multicomponent Na+:H+ antiporter subunit B
MTRRARTRLFLAGGGGLAALLGWAISGLPAFGDYPGPYGLVLNRVELGQRHATNVIAAIVFDYRGFDTMGEEFILFTAVAGVALLLRQVREEDAKRVRVEVRSDAVRALGLAFVPVGVLLALFVITFGYITPGGGFQGGAALALALVLVYLAADHASYRKLTPTPVVDFFEGFGAGAFVALGLGTLVAGLAYQENFLPLGTIGLLTSAGSIGLLNVATAIEVTAAFLLLFAEFLEEVMVEHRGGKQ